MNTITDEGVTFEIAWDGSFDGAWWREYGETAPPVDASAVSATALVRDYMDARPGIWVTAVEVLAAVAVSYEQARDRLRQLVITGELQRRRAEDGRCWRYRWVERPGKALCMSKEAIRKRAYRDRQEAHAVEALLLPRIPKLSAAYRARREPAA